MPLVSLCFQIAPGADKDLIILGVPATYDGKTVNPDGKGIYHVDVKPTDEGKFVFFGKAHDLRVGGVTVEAEKETVVSVTELEVESVKDAEELDAPDTVSGVYQRLHLLGYVPFRPKQLGYEAEQGLIDFQADHDLEITGNPLDKRAQTKLDEVVQANRIEARYLRRHHVLRFVKAFTGWDSMELEPNLDDRGFKRINTCGGDMEGPAVSVTAGTVFAVEVIRLNAAPSVKLAIESDDAKVVSAEECPELVGKDVERLVLEAKEPGRTQVRVLIGEVVVARLSVLVWKPLEVRLAPFVAAIRGSLRAQFPPVDLDKVPRDVNAQGPVPESWREQLVLAGYAVPKGATCTCIAKAGPKPRIWRVEGMPIKVKHEAAMPTLHRNGEPLPLPLSRAYALWADLRIPLAIGEKEVTTQMMQRLHAALAYHGISLSPEGKLVLEKSDATGMEWTIYTGAEQLKAYAAVAMLSIHALLEGEHLPLEGEHLSPEHFLKWYRPMMNIARRIWNPCGVVFQAPEKPEIAQVDLSVPGSLALVSEVKNPKNSTDTYLDYGGSDRKESVLLRGQIVVKDAVKIVFVENISSTTAETLTRQHGKHPSIGIVMGPRSELVPTAVDFAHELLHYLADVGMHSDDAYSSEYRTAIKDDRFDDIAKIKRLLYSTYACRSRPAHRWASNVGCGEGIYGTLITLRGVDHSTEYQSGESECVRVRSRIEAGTTYYPEA